MAALQICTVPGKGRGVCAAARISKHSRVCEYDGELVVGTQAVLDREIQLGDADNSYLFLFQWQGTTACIDATAEDGTFGRLINHSRTRANLRPQRQVTHGVPRIVFVATRQIEAGEELLYDYGDRRPQSLAHFPWLASS